MSSAYILFLSEADRVRGFGTLARRAKVSSLPDQVYQVTVEALRLLEDEQIKYRRATDAEVKAVDLLLHESSFKPSPDNPSLGLFADEPELIDEIMKDVYVARETHRLSAPI